MSFFGSCELRCSQFVISLCKFLIRVNMSWIVSLPMRNAIIIARLRPLKPSFPWEGGTYRASFLIAYGHCNIVL